MTASKTLPAVHGLVRARHEAKTANEALDFLVGMFQEADPHLIPDELSAQAPDGRPRGETLTAKEILERGAKRLETRLMDEPEARARLLDALGRTNGSLGLLDVAARQLRAALELRREELAATLRAQGRTAESDALLRENAKAGSPDGEPPAPP